MSSLLINESPLLVLPRLASAIGLHEAIFLQQVHYWITKESAIHAEGKRWHFDTYEGWRNQFKFCSVATIKRTLLVLERHLNLLESKQFNLQKGDCTKFYTINYNTLNEIEKYLTCNKIPSVDFDRPSGQIDLTLGSSRPDPRVKLTRSTITKNTSKNTSKINKRARELLNKNDETDSFEEFWKLYPNKKAKAKAYPSWVKAISLTSKDVIFNAIIAQCKERAQKSSLGVFVPEWPHPSTWLNQMRWQDEIEPSEAIRKRGGKTFEERKQESTEKQLEAAMDTSYLSALIAGRKKVNEEDGRK